ncbi:MAG: FMN-binding protein [Spirochaetes bacterium]|nr:FMN-binding protein [Spirochaetota bacterium]
MRKLSIALVILVLTAGMAFAAGPWQDGTYTAEADEFDHGWKPFVQITVMGGYIADVHFDNYAEEGDKTKYVASVQGEYGMVENSGAQWPWYEQADRAAAYLVETQDPAQAVRQANADAISGVSVTVNYFYNLAQDALSGARR